MAVSNYPTKLNYSDTITADFLNIKYDGILYKNLQRKSNGFGQIYYGSDPKSLTNGALHEYPFSLVVEDPQQEGVYLWKERSKSFSISASIPSTETVTTTPCFDKARGYECKEESTLLTDESVTTEDDGGYGIGRLASTTPITAEKIKVTFDGEEYICVAQTDAFGGTFYGAAEAKLGFDWSEYPFCVTNGGLMGNEIKTETVGTHQVKIEAYDISIATTPCFEKAVKSVSTDCNWTEIRVPATFNSITDLVESKNSESFTIASGNIATIKTDVIPLSAFGVAMSLAGFSVGGVDVNGTVLIQKVVPLPSERRFEVTVKNYGTAVATVPANGVVIYALCYKNLSTKYKLCAAPSHPLI